LKYLEIAFIIMVINNLNFFRILSLAFLSPMPLFLIACGSPGYDSTNTVANSILINGYVDEVNADLSNKSCTTALSVIYPLYNSSNTTNDVRMATAASYGCSATVDVFQIISDLTSASNLNGSGLWKFLVKEFPSKSSPDDKIPTTAAYGIDAVMSAIKTGTTIVSADEINSTTHNPGSILLTDRIQDANSYLTFLAMAQMGSLLYRNGVPNTSTYVKTVSLPWLTAATVKGDGCAFTSGLLNLIDGLDSIVSYVPSSSKSSFQSIISYLSSSTDAACAVGCTVICAGSVSCSRCPTTLRNRNSCTGLTTDVNSCAAAGLAYFVNESWI
jgi:hypothetical protein